MTTQLKMQHLQVRSKECKFVWCNVDVELMRLMLSWADEIDGSKEDTLLKERHVSVHFYHFVKSSLF